jgi:hypothetical protein
MNQLGDERTAHFNSPVETELSNCSGIVARKQARYRFPMNTPIPHQPASQHTEIFVCAIYPGSWAVSGHSASTMRIFLELLPPSSDAEFGLRIEMSE